MVGNLPTEFCDQANGPGGEGGGRGADIAEFASHGWYGAPGTSPDTAAVHSTGQSRYRTLAHNEVYKFIATLTLYE